MTDVKPKLMTKGKYEKMADAGKYCEEPDEEVQKVIEEAEKDTLLKLEIRMTGGFKVLDAMTIENREDMVEALTKSGDEE